MSFDPSRRELLAPLGAGGAAIALGRDTPGQTYADAFMKNVQWDEVNRRTEWAQKATRP